MSLFVLCQDCGEVYDSQGMGHSCFIGSYSGDCEHCRHYGTDMKYDSQNNIYYHRDPFSCISNLQQEISHTGSHCLENDSRYFNLENNTAELDKKITEFMEGRRAAVEATKEKNHNQSTEATSNAIE